MGHVSPAPRKVVQTVSLRQDQREAVIRLVHEDLKHGNLSRYIQDLIDADLAERAKQAVDPQAVAS